MTVADARRNAVQSAGSCAYGSVETGDPAIALLPLHTAPGHLIRVAQQVHERIWQRHVGTTQTSVQYGLLLALATQHEMDQQTLGETMSLDTSNLTDVLARLGRRGLIARNRHPEDGRRKVVQVTPEGIAAVLAAAPDVVTVQQEVMALLEPHRQAACLDLLSRLAFRGIGPDVPTTGHPAGSIAGWPSELSPITLHAAPGHLIRRAEQVHTLLWNEHVGARLTSVQYVVLLTLNAFSGIDQRALGRHASLDKSTAGDLVARLVARGFITRIRDIGDRRRNILKLTAAGQSELRIHSPAVLRVQEDLLSPLTGLQQQSFLFLMGRLTGTSP